VYILYIIVLKIQNDHGENIAYHVPGVTAAFRKSFLYFAAMHSLSEENYLKAIFNLSTDESKVTPTAIAEALSNNPASVIDMIRKLTEKELIEYNKKTGASLTPNGRKAAIAIVRKHRLWEVFLKEKLGYTWDEVHDIAEQMEHIKHPDLADRLDHFLGYPPYDPHGDPIPQANGKMAKAYRTNLADIDAGKSCQVFAVKDTSSSFLQYLQKLGIDIGTHIKLIEKIPFDDSLVINIGKGADVTVSRKFAEHVLVG
jgi:DtxR family Mn-dependent transcriptional regulator